MSDVSPAVETAQTPPPERGRERSSRSIGDMIRSLVVVGGVVVILVLIVPRPSSVSQPPIDVPGVAQGARPDAKFPLSVPQGLPPEWRATSARLLNGTDNVQTWHVGFQTADAQYAALEQAQNATTTWVRANTQGGTVVGTQVVDGVTWTQILHENRLQRTLQLTTGSLTTLVTGTASWADLGVLAASLQPAP